MLRSFRGINPSTPSAVLSAVVCDGKQSFTEDQWFLLWIFCL